MPLTMTKAEREAFLADVHVAVISIADDHGPLVVPMWYSHEPGGEVRVITGRTSRKRKLLERAGRFSLCVQTETLPYKYVSMEGAVVAVEAADLERDRRPSRAAISASKRATRTSKARGAWSVTCLFVCGQNAGSQSTMQSNTKHGEWQAG